MLEEGVEVSADSAPRLDQWRVHSLLMACAAGLAVTAVLAVATALLAEGEDGAAIALIAMLLMVGVSGLLALRRRVGASQARRRSRPTMPLNTVRFCRDPRWSGRVQPFAAPRPPRPEQRPTRTCTSTHRR